MITFLPAFMVYGLLVFAIAALGFLIAFTDPRYEGEEMVDVTENGSVVQKPVKVKKFSYFGIAVELIGIPTMILLGILLCLLAFDSDHLVQARLTAWNFFGDSNPDNVHAVYDAPENLVVEKGVVTFDLPQRLKPIWIIVEVIKEDGTPDSKSVSLDCVTTVTKDKDGKEIPTVKRVTYRNVLISPEKPLKAMYALATGPSAEVKYAPPGTTTTTEASVAVTCCHGR